MIFIKLSENTILLELFEKHRNLIQEAKRIQRELMETRIAIDNELKREGYGLRVIPIPLEYKS